MLSAHWAPPLWSMGRPWWEGEGEGRESGVRVVWGRGIKRIAVRLLLGTRRCVVTAFPRTQPAPADDILSGRREFGIIKRFFPVFTMQPYVVHSRPAFCWQLLRLRRKDVRGLWDQKKRRRHSLQWNHVLEVSRSISSNHKTA